jgi:AcrR family transcriptional regulator
LHVDRSSAKFEQLLKATAQGDSVVIPTRSETKELIVGAALATLKEEGFAGASARSIARRGGFNQALIFYHFGSIDDLLLAALDDTSARRMTAYEDALSNADSFDELVRVAVRMYEEDLRSGHITVLSEMIVGGLSHPRLREALIDRMQPWIDLVKRAIERSFNESFLASMMSAENIAYGVVALYLGIDLLTHLDPDRAGAKPLFAAATHLASVAGLPGGK